jgi:iron(III) transport system permease protein
MTATQAAPFKPAAAARVRSWLAMALIYAGLLVAVGYPLAILLKEALVEETGDTIGTVLGIFASRDVVSAITNTCIISVVALIIATLIGVTLAWFVARTNMPGKRLFDPLNVIPFYLSSIVGALSWQVIAAPRAGILNQAIEAVFGVSGFFNIYSVWGIGLVIGLFYAPYVYLFTLGSLQSMDAALEEAARMSGATVWQTALRITMPLSAPAIFSAGILVFVTSAGIFGVPLVLGPPGRVNTISTLIFRYVNDYPAQYGVATILSLSLLLFTASLTIIQVLLLRRRRFTTVTGKGYRPREVDLHRWKWFAVAVNIVYLIFVIGPFAVLLMVSFQNSWTGSFQWDRLTLDNYHMVLFTDMSTRRGFFNSMVIGIVGATLAVAICTLLALVVQRTKMPARKGVVGLTMLPVAIPGIVLGTGFLFAWISTPLYGTIWLMMAAYIVHYLPTGFRSIESLIQAISPELDESARMSGAGWWRSIGFIIVPLITSGIISTWLLLFVTFIREVSASMILFTFGTETMSIALIRIMQYGSFGESGAFGVLQTLLLLACVVLIRQLSARISTYRSNRMAAAAATEL